MANTGTFRIYVRIDKNEIEISYPLTERNVVEYGPKGTLTSAISAIKDIIDKIKEK